jgi:enoyl-CoA hydratase/carnithine racemase
LYETKNGAAWVTINRPSRMNSFRAQTQDEVIAACAQANDDAGARVVVFTGVGDAFCAGADIKEMDDSAEQDAASVDRTLRHDWKFYTAIRNIGKPVISRINGVAVGGGSNIVMASDIRIASDKARFGFPFQNIGLCGADGGCTYFLPRAVGYAMAAELIFTGRLFSAQEALHLGLINRVVPHHRLDEEVATVVEQIASKSPLALRNAKLALSASLDKDIASEYDYEMLVTTQCMLSNDFREGVAAFKEKRAPRFTGR